MKRMGVKKRKTFWRVPNITRSELAGVLLTVLPHGGEKGVLGVNGNTHMSARLAVVASLCNGVEGLLALHTQRHFFFPDRGGSTLS